MKCVADSQTIINPQGVLFVEKREQRWSAEGPLKYYLFVKYRTAELNHQYERVEDRDAQFEALAKALAPTPAGGTGR